MSVQKHQIYWITGQSGAGKTTLATALQKVIGGIVLDGDEMRASISLGSGFTQADREEHNMRVARLVQALSLQMVVIVSVIAPFAVTRAKVTDLIDPVWIYIARDLPLHENKPYEIPRCPHIALNSDNQEVYEEVQIVRAFIRSGK